MTSVRLVGRLDHNFAWDGRLLYEDADLIAAGGVRSELRGAAAVVQARGPEAWRILRDPLGINKLFWATSDGGVVFAARPHRLIVVGHDFEEIRAIPRGSVIDVTTVSVKRESISFPRGSTHPPDSSDASVDDLAHRIRSTLDRYLEALASRYEGARAFVCLSGGLDSSGVAALAREHFPDVVAVSFSLERKRASKSEDWAAGRRLARELEIAWLDATESERVLLDSVDLVLLEGIDWRDFNVHTALVNAALARAVDAAVSSRESGTSVIVLTGDLPNEFLADYQPERYQGAAYYTLPRVSPAMLRQMLIAGLDSCNREVGIFEAWNLPVVQPYAAAVDLYMALPPAFLERADRKQQLARSIFGNALPDYVYNRPKVRAQIGSAGDISGSVLAACIDHGLDQAELRRRFASLHKVGRPAALGRLIRAGRYWSAVPRVSIGDDASS